MWLLKYRLFAKNLNFDQSTYGTCVFKRLVEKDEQSVKKWFIHQKEPYFCKPLDAIFEKY